VHCHWSVYENFCQTPTEFDKIFDKFIPFPRFVFDIAYLYWKGTLKSNQPTCFRDAYCGFTTRTSYYSGLGRSAKYCDERLCMSVCLSACTSQKITRPNFMKFSVHVSWDRGSVLFWRRWNMSCTSGFVDDVMFSLQHVALATSTSVKKVVKIFATYSPESATQFDFVVVSELIVQYILWPTTRLTHQWTDPWPTWPPDLWLTSCDYCLSSAHLLHQQPTQLHV